MSTIVNQALHRKKRCSYKWKAHQGDFIVKGIVQTTSNRYAKNPTSKSPGIVWFPWNSMSVFLPFFVILAYVGRLMLPLMLHLRLSTLHPDFQIRRRSGEKHLTSDMFQENSIKNTKGLRKGSYWPNGNALNKNKHLMPAGGTKASRPQ